MTGINVEREILLPLLLDSNEIYKIKKRKKKKILIIQGIR